MIEVFEDLVKWLPISVSVVLLAISLIGFVYSYFLDFLDKELVRIACILLVGFGLFQLGAQEFYKEQKVEIKKEIQYIHDVQVKQVVVTNTVVKWLHDKKQNTGNNYAAIENSITTKDDAQCNLPSSFVGVFNAAATNTIPNTASGANGSASSPVADSSGVKLSEAEKVIVANDKTYFDVANQLTALQQWVTDQKALADKKP